MRRALERLLAPILVCPGVGYGQPRPQSPPPRFEVASLLDPRSDLFSLGVILHELATGRHPSLRDDPSGHHGRHSA